MEKLYMLEEDNERLRGEIKLLNASGDDTKVDTRMIN